MEETVTKDRPFALMLSIPDPHGKCLDNFA